jgi:hypothetical protein
MGRVSYDLRDPDAVNTYLTRVACEHNQAFERWRLNRIRTGFPVLIVEHPEGVPTPPSEAGFPENDRRRRGF